MDEVVRLEVLFKENYEAWNSTTIRTMFSWLRESVCNIQETRVIIFLFIIAEGKGMVVHAETYTSRGYRCGFYSEFIFCREQGVETGA